MLGSETEQCVLQHVLEHTCGHGDLLVPSPLESEGTHITSDTTLPNDQQQHHIELGSIVFSIYSSLVVMASKLCQELPVVHYKFLYLVL